MPTRIRNEMAEMLSFVRVLYGLVSIFVVKQLDFIQNINCLSKMQKKLLF